MAIKLRAKQRLAAAMLISFSFFVTELAGQSNVEPLEGIPNYSIHLADHVRVPPVAYKTSSLALLADSFHYVG